MQWFLFKVQTVSTCHLGVNGNQIQHVYKITFRRKIPLTVTMYFITCQSLYLEYVAILNSTFKCMCFVTIFNIAIFFLLNHVVIRTLTHVRIYFCFMYLVHFAFFSVQKQTCEVYKSNFYEICKLNWVKLACKTNTVNTV